MIIMELLNNSYVIYKFIGPLIMFVVYGLGPSFEYGSMVLTD